MGLQNKGLRPHDVTVPSSAGGGITQLTGDATAGPGSGSQAITVSKFNDGTDFGSAAGFDVGTGPDNVVQLDGTSKLPAVDGSQLTNLPGGGGGNGFTASGGGSAGNWAALPPDSGAAVYITGQDGLTPSESGGAVFQFGGHGADGDAMSTNGTNGGIAGSTGGNGGSAFSGSGGNGGDGGGFTVTLGSGGSGDGAGQNGADGMFTVSPGLVSAADDAAAAAAGVPVTGFYRTASVVKIRVA